MNWLHELIFDYVRAMWRGHHPESHWSDSVFRFLFRKKVHQPSMERLILQEIVDADLSTTILSGQALRTWCYEGADFELQEGEFTGELTIRRQEAVGSRRCHYFVQGLVRFYISPDHKNLYIDSFLGPLSGRGCLYDVRDKGPKRALRFRNLRWMS